jgi:hypothetical protein
MAPTIGTYTMADLRSNRFQSAAAFGLDTINQVLQADLAAHNAIVQSMAADLAEETTDRQRIYGSSAEGEMQESDELGRPLAMRSLTGATVGFPLRKYPVAIGWTQDYFYSATPADVATTFFGVQTSHLRAMTREMKKAIFGATNYTFRDRFASPQIDLGVKRFVNADGDPIPNGPNGEVFNPSTHTHYNFIDGTQPTAAALTALIFNVVEHGHGNNVKVFINIAAEATVRTLTGFTAYLDPRVSVNTAANQATEQRLDISRVDNRAIGIFGAAEVWVKSWVPAGYVFCADTGSPMKPLCSRIHTAPELRGLRIASRLNDYPLIADNMDAYFGYGVYTRTNGACLYYASGASAYVSPTIT